LMLTTEAMVADHVDKPSSDSDGSSTSDTRFQGH
jgi:hypothetical protein